ncbi:Crp/Fnr family transcriptional regulator [Macrococcoides caseolyticum]|uniref:Crp/Fnr family transcriptional regulator n=1 Tax=Macrococcoides caseolyticum TaxID=69966 RepID=UPI000C333C23|nr:Crp/Fnr family transcriptional regulator [Macrococcus caseolyticus]PKD97852.1 Crp/Fnr family transcriptional regulator [Macrococcus caseolyticus]PKF18330.1 Crp/Fnr family transcriptional regulator [Macrococcus caseolyticus]
MNNNMMHFPFFKMLNTHELAAVATISQIQHYKKLNHIFYDQTEMTHFYFVEEGTVKIYRTDVNGKEQIVNFFGPGELFPHHAFFRTGPYPANAVVVEDAKILSISKNEFETLVNMNPELSIKMFKYLGNLIVDLQKRLQEKILEPTPQQLLLMLKRLALMHGEVENNDFTKILLKINKQELANMLGLTRETVSRNFTVFKKMHILKEDADGFIEINLHKIKDSK